MLPLLVTPPDFVQFVMAAGAAIMGVSHILHPDAWREFFAWLHRQGRAGLIAKVMLVELWPALFIVALHQVWWGPGIVLTLYGWALLLKVTISVLVPDLGVRSMAIPDRLPRSFVPAGIALLGVALASAAALFW